MELLMADNPDDATLTFDDEAEVLVAHQLDLLAQLEAQLRAVHHTMRCIAQLRSAKFRIGPALTDRQRARLLEGLSVEVGELDRQLNIERECCVYMQQTITQMQVRTANLRRTARGLSPPAPDADP